MSAYDSVLVSPMVDLLAKRVATNVAIKGSSLSIRSVNSSSVLANAHASLPVLSLTLVGGSTPRDLSNSANLSLLISCFLRSSSFLTPSKCISVTNEPRLSARICIKSSTNSLSSSSRVGSANIRIVKSTTRSSPLGKLGSILLKML